jgi:hypothetical protein
VLLVDSNFSPLHGAPRVPMFPPLQVTPTSSASFRPSSLLASPPSSLTPPTTTSCRSRRLHRPERPSDVVPATAEEASTASHVVSHVPLFFCKIEPPHLPLSHGASPLEPCRCQRPDGRAPATACVSWPARIHAWARPQKIWPSQRALTLAEAGRARP